MDAESRGSASTHLIVVLGQGLWLAFCIAATLSYAEVLTAAQDPYWFDESLVGDTDTLAGFGIYWVSITVIAAFLLCALLILLRSTRIVRLCPILSVSISAVLVWVAVRVPLGSVLSGTDFAVMGACAAFGVCGSLLVGFGFLGAWRYGTVWILAAIGATSALRVGAFLSPLDAHWVNLSAGLSLAFMGVLLLLGLILWSLAVRRRLLLTMVFLLAVASLPAGYRVWPWLKSIGEEPKGPSLILVTADSLRADYCSVYGGNVQMASLDALARRGVILKHYYSLAPWTVASLDGLFAGKYPPGLSLGASDQQHEREEMSYFRLASYWKEDDTVTWLGRLREKGYVTAAFVGNPCMMWEKWLADQFGQFAFVDVYSDRPSRFVHFPSLRRFMCLWFPAFSATKKVDSTSALTHCAEAFLRLHRDQSLFLWVHFMDPHTPYDPPARYRTQKGQWESYPPGSSLIPMPDSALPGTPEQKSFVRSLYEGEIRYVDDALGTILTTCNRVNMTDRCFLAFSSDHGEEFWSHGRWGHGHALYEEQIRVPMVMAGPGLERQVIDIPVSAIDLMPTFADLLKIPPPSSWHGQSLLPLLKGESSQQDGARQVFAQATYCTTFHEEPQRTVVRGGWKLIERLESNKDELYDLTHDPKEQHDRYGERLLVAEELEQLLHGWADSFPSSFAHFQGVDDMTLPADEQREEVLRALGYLGD